MTTCSITDCAAPAAYRAEMVIYARVNYVHPPAIGTMGIQVCADHATDDNAASLLSDQGKRMIEAKFAGIGRALPDWKRSFVRWRKL